MGTQINQGISSASIPDGSVTSADVLDGSLVSEDIDLTEFFADPDVTGPLGTAIVTGVAALLDTDLSSGGEDDNHIPTALAVKSYAAPIASPTFTGTVTGRIGPRVTSITSSATPTINTDNCDAVNITALAVAITSMTTNLSGTPTNFQKLTIRFKDDGTGRAITWGASFESVGATLPTTTTANKRTTVGLIYDSVAAKWGCVAAVTEA